MKFGTLQHILNYMTVSSPKKWNFSNSGWRYSRHLENRFFGHNLYNLSTDCPITAKFCTRKQNGMSTRAEWQNLQIFKIQDGGTGNGTIG